MKRACVTCGQPTINGNRCPTHAPAAGHRPHTGYSPYRDRGKQHTFRRALIARAHGRCERCGSTDDLRACHIIALVDGGTYDLANGLLLCRRCDIESDPHAR